MEATFEAVLKIIILAIEIFAVTVFVYGTVGCAINFVAFLINKDTTKNSFSKIMVIKNTLAAYVLLALEILIVADVIETLTLDHSISSLTRLGAIVILRTVISFFLAKETEEFKKFEEEK